MSQNLLCCPHAAKEVGGDALMGVASSSAVDIAVQLDDNRGDLSKVDLVRTAKQAPGAALSGVLGSRTGRNLNPITAKAAPKAGDLGTDLTAKAAEKLGQNLAPKAGSVGATLGGTAYSLAGSADASARQREDKQP